MRLPPWGKGAGRAGLKFVAARLGSGRRVLRFPRIGPARSVLLHLSPPSAVLRRTIGSFHPRHVPAVSRRNYRRELLSAFLFPFGLAAVEGAVVGAIVKSSYEPVAEELTLNIVVGLLMAMPELANITSFVWAGVAHGRDKVRLIAVLQAVVVAMAMIVALAPRSADGLWLFASAVVVARVAMAGVFTIRATVWGMNYARAERARATGRFNSITVMVLACIAMLVGAANDLGEGFFRGLIIASSLVGAVGVAAYSRIRLRRHRVLLRDEIRAARESGQPAWSPLAIAQVLARDGNYARFQVWMNVLGIGNLMLTAPLTLMLKEDFNVSTFEAVAITYAVPCFVMPWAIPFWAKLLADRHVVRFRAVHSWVFVASQGLVLLGAVTHQPALLYLGMMVQGVGYAGGSLAWNLGHLDFAPPHEASRYMGVHVTLNGVRGLLGPLVAVGAYEWLKRFTDDSGQRLGLEHWVFAGSVAVVAVGAIGFGRLARRMNLAAVHARVS